jgi:transcriptional regulator with XRE-family HTH domain
MPAIILSGPAVRRARRAAGLRQKDLADRLRELRLEAYLTQPGVSAIETGADTRPFIELDACRWAVALGVPLSDLLSRPVRLAPPPAAPRGHAEVTELRRLMADGAAG